MKKNKMIAAMLLSLLPILSATEEKNSGNFSFGFSYQGAFSDNIFMNASRIKDYVSTLETSLDWTLDSLNIFLSATASLFSDNPDFNSLQIEPGIEYLMQMKGRNALYLSARYNRLSYHDAYTDFNYQGPVLSASLKLYAGQTILVKGAYQFEYRSYGNFDSFDFGNHSLLIEVSRFFRSQTTVSLTSGFNYRLYPHVADDYSAGEESVFFGRGYGKRNNQSHTGVQNTSHTMSVPNLTSRLRISQGIGTRVGISAEAEYRINLRGLENADTLIENAYILYPYNDDYLWDGLRLSLRLKTVLPKEWSIEASVSRFDKGYPGIYVTDPDGMVIDPLRERSDTQTLWTLSVNRKISRWELSSGLSFTDNRSNDAFFDYSATVVYAGVSFFF